MTCRRVSPGCPFCPPRGLPDGSRKLLSRRLLQPIARWWLATVAAVEAESALQLGDPALQAFNQLLQRGVLGQQPLDVRFQGIFGFARRIGPIRRLSHWQLDSRRYPSRQAISSRTWAVTVLVLSLLGEGDSEN